MHLCGWLAGWTVTDAAGGLFGDGGIYGGVIQVGATGTFLLLRASSEVMCSREISHPNFSSLLDSLLRIA